MAPVPTSLTLHLGIWISEHLSSRHEYHLRHRSQSRREGRRGLGATFDEVITSVVVAGELRAWISKTQSARLERLIATTLVAIPVLPLGPEVADVYGDLRIKLERIGKSIGSNDLWIAAHAISLGAVVVTDNTREFARVPNLPLQNWLRE